MSRNRMTNRRRASAAPALPEDPSGEKHPAMYPDPGKDDYKNGDTSAWAEDVHPGPYSDTPAPQMPTEDGAHPAAARRAALKKANQCVELAVAMLGRTASAEVVQAQALEMMDWDDSKVASSLQRVASSRKAGWGGDDHMGMWEDDGDMWGMGDDDMDDMDDMGMWDDEDDMGMWGEDDDMGMMRDRMASGLSKLGSEERAMLMEMLREAADDDEDEDEEEEGKKASDDEDEDEDEEEGKKASDDDDEDEDEDEEGSDKEAAFDPMNTDIETDAALRALWAGDDEEEEEDEEDDEEEEEEEDMKSKKASLRPRPRKRSKVNSPKTLGNVSKSASDNVSSLSNFWNSAPDVSDVFGTTPTKLD